MIPFQHLIETRINWTLSIKPQQSSDVTITNHCFDLPPPATATQQHPRTKPEWRLHTRPVIKKATATPELLRAQRAASGSWGASAGHGTRAPGGPGRRAWASWGGRQSWAWSAPAPTAGDSSSRAPCGWGTAPWGGAPPPRPPCPPWRTRTAPSMPAGAASSALREATSTARRRRRDRERVSRSWRELSAAVGCLAGDVCVYIVSSKLLTNFFICHILV